MVNHNLAYTIDNDSHKTLTEIDEIPLKWGAVPLSEVILKGKRLEASVYDVDVQKAYQIIEHGRYVPVPLIDAEKGPVVHSHYGSRLKRTYVDRKHENAIGFIGSAEMLDIKPRPVKFVVNTERIASFKVSEGTVLISRSGTIGNVSFVNKTLSHFMLSEDAIRLECNDCSGYVYAFLKTKAGQTLVHSKIYGAVIAHIEPEHLSSIPIPNAPEEIKSKIHSCVVHSYELRDESNALIDEATSLLRKELQLPELEDMECCCFNTNANLKTFGVKASSLNGRIDASYHLPIVQALITHLSKHAAEVTTIGDTRISKDVILPGRFKRVYVQEGNGRIFIGGKQIGELDPSNKKYLSLVHHGDRIIRQLELHQNMTLITCSGTIGKVALVGKHWEKWAASQHIIRVVPFNDDIAGYINIFLASDYGRVLITRNTYGAVVDEINDKHVRSIPIPLLKNPLVQQRINNLALLANQKRYEAYLLECEALKIMEDEVLFAR